MSFGGFYLRLKKLSCDGTLGAVLVRLETMISSAIHDPRHREGFLIWFSTNLDTAQIDSMFSNDVKYVRFEVRSVRDEMMAFHSASLRLLLEENSVDPISFRCCGYFSIVFIV